MSHPRPELDEQALAWLVAWDEALASGTPPPSHLAADPAHRLSRLQTCLRRLHAVHPANTPPHDQTPPPEEAEALHAAFPLTQLGRFQVQRLLGGGGFGLVYLAYDGVLRRAVAVKVPRPEALLTPEARARFLHEGQTAAGLDHPNLVRVYEANQHGSLVYLISEYCPGPTLDAWLRERREPVPLAEAVAVLLQLADGVAYMHGRGVLHRDLKPANVLLQTTDNTDDTDKEERKVPPSSSVLSVSSVVSFVPRITDFGLAKDVQRTTQLTRSGTVLGTPRYMAPEQARAAESAGDGAVEIGAAADVYALGAILYELLTGRPPFAGGSDLETLRQVLEDEPVPLRRLRPSVHRDLETICLKCLEKEPRRRYADAAALADDLRRFGEGRPIQARPARWYARAWKWARRRPALAALLGVILLAAASAIVATVLYVRQLDAHARQLRDLAERERAARSRAELLVYAGRIRLAFEAVEDKKILPAVEMLQALRPEPGQDDPRGFEWHYLKGLCRPLHAVWRGHLKPLEAVAVAPDGATVATGGQDQTIRLWDAATGRPRMVLQGQTQTHRLFFAPDGRTLLALNHTPGEVVRWDLESGIALSRVAMPELCMGYLAAATPDGTTAVLRRGRDGALLLVEVATGKWRELVTLPTPDHRRWVTAAFSPDGNALALGQFPGTVELRDAHTGELRHEFHGYSGPVFDVAFAPDGSLLATASRGDGTVRLWDPATGKPRAVLNGHAHSAFYVAFAPDGRTLASVGMRVQQRWDLPEILVWDVAEGRLRARFQEQDSLTIRSLAFLADSRRLAFGSDDRTVRVLDTTPHLPAETLPGHAPKETWSLAFSPDGHTLASAGDDHLIKLWDVATGKEKATLQGHDALVTSVAFAPDGRTLASASFDETVRLWDAETGRPRTTWPAAGRLHGLAFSPDGKVLAVGTGMKQGETRNWGAVRLWEVATGRELPPLEELEWGVGSVAFSPDGTILAASSGVGKIRFWDTVTWQPRTSPESAIEFWCVAFSRKGDVLAAGSTEGILRLWDVATCRERAVIQAHPSEIRAVAFSPDGRTLASAGDDQTVRLWQATTGEELLTLKGHTARVNAVAFSPDGCVLASADHTGAIRLWRTPEPATPNQ